MVATVGPKLAGISERWSKDLHQAISKLNLEPVVGQADVRGELGVGGGVVEVVAHVGEEGALRLELLDDGDGVVEVRVAGVGIATQGVEDEDVEILQEGNADFGRCRSCR